ncbi:PRC-barrel domain-containing protein [Nitrospira sp. Nam80]
MNTETWVVRTLGGEEWGFIKRLIIDPMTRQIKEADIILAETGKVIRIPWDNLDVQTEGITLRVAKGEVHAIPPPPSEAGMAASVAMDLWP